MYEPYNLDDRRMDSTKAEKNAGRIAVHKIQPAVHRQSQTTKGIALPRKSTSYIDFFQHIWFHELICSVGRIACSVTFLLPQSHIDIRKTCQEALAFLDLDNGDFVPNLWGLTVTPKRTIPKCPFPQHPLHSISITMEDTMLPSPVRSKQMLYDTLLHDV